MIYSEYTITRYDSFLGSDVSGHDLRDISERVLAH